MTVSGEAARARTWIGVVADDAPRRHIGWVYAQNWYVHIYLCWRRPWQSRVAVKHARRCGAKALP